MSHPALDILARVKELTEPALERWVDTLIPNLRGPARYHLGFDDGEGNALAGPARVGGKRIRPALTVLAAEAVGADGATALPGAVAVELVHNFSLLHDDIIDGDTERHHRPTVWHKWGLGDGVIVGDALHTLAFGVLLDDGSTEGTRAAAMLATQTAAMIVGQSNDMTLDHRDRVSFADCVAMEADKTGALLAFAASVGGVLAGGSDAQSSALASFGLELGMAFQAVDDLLGIWGDPAVTGKPSHSDLRERKRSMPVTAALESGTDAGEELARLYRGVDPDANDLAHIAHLIETAGGRARTEAEASSRIAGALDALDTAPFAAGPVAELKHVADFVVNRSF